MAREQNLYFFLRSQIGESIATKKKAEEIFDIGALSTWSFSIPCNLLGEISGFTRGPASSESSFLTRLIRIRRGVKSLLAERRHSSPD